MKRATHYLSALAVVALLSGCGAGLNKLMGVPSTPQEFVTAQQDKEMAKAFSSYFEHNKHAIRSYKTGFGLKTKIVAFENMKVNRSNAAYHVNSMNLDKDELAEVYKNAVLQRGNSYKVFKSALNKKAFEALARGPLATTDGLDYYYYDWAPAIIEYDNSGRMVSMLIRKMTLTPHPMGKRDPSAPVRIIMDTNIFNQSQAYRLENGLTNNDLADYELYSSASKTPKNAPMESSNIEKIKELHELHKAGALSKEEFEAEKAKLLSEKQQPATRKAPATSSTNSIKEALMRRFNQ